MSSLKKYLRIFFQLLFVAFLILCVFNYKVLNYGIAQAKGEIKILMDVKDINEVLASKDFPDSLKPKLVLIQEIKKFAEDSLGIKKSENYTTIYDQKGYTLMWMLMASKPFAMEAKQWHFPFLGDFSYKGFFDKKKARTEQYNLKQEGYDTELGKASGWSTLGWFKDPVLSNMLYNSKGVLAELIIHELTHGTLYVKNNVDFNENLASFVGEKGAEKFLLMKFGKHSEEITNYKSNLADEKVFEKYLFNSTQQLKINSFFFFSFISSLS